MRKGLCGKRKHVKKGVKIIAKEREGGKERQKAITSGKDEERMEGGRDRKEKKKNSGE